MMHSVERVEKRMARKTDRPDIWTYVMRYSESEENKEKGLSTTEMHSDAALFMLAGTETTATELSGMTHYLLKDPVRMERLKREIRDAFPTYEDMTMTKLSQLEYLGACIEEGLRMYPPVALGLPRTAPKGGAKVNGYWVPEGVSLVAFKTDLQNTTDRSRQLSNSLSTQRTIQQATSRILTSIVSSNI